MANKADSPTQMDRPVDHADEQTPLRHRGGSTSSFLSYRASLGVVQLSTLIFFEVSGGSYGIEPIVRAGRPFWAIVGLIVIPIVWSIPIALVTAELSSRYPETGGQVMWANRAFGLKICYYQGYLSFLGNLADTAACPVMVLDYMEAITGPRSSIERFLVGLCALAFITYLNVRGVEMVGAASVVFAFLCISPFIVFIGLGWQYVDPHVWMDMGTFDFKPFQFDSTFATFLTCLVWNTSGYDMAGACAGEVRNARKVYPTALFISVTIVSLIYLGPVLIGVCVPGVMDYDQWDDGFFSTGVARALGGNGFAIVMGLVGAVASLGQLNSLLLASSRELFCMSGLGLTPKVLDNIHPAYQTPYFSVILMSACVAPLILFNFDTLVEVSTFLDSIAFCVFFAAYLKLKYDDNKTNRQGHTVEGGYGEVLAIEPHNVDDIFQVPGGIVGGILVCIPPLLVCALVVFVCSISTWIVCGVTLTLMWVVWQSWLQKHIKSNLGECSS